MEDSEDLTDQEYKRVHHVRVLSRLACESQCRTLLKSRADRILTRDRPWFDIFAGVVVLVGAVMLYVRPEQRRSWGVMILVASALNIFFGMMVLLAGTMGVIGGVLALGTKDYLNREHP